MQKGTLRSWSAKAFTGLTLALVTGMYSCTDKARSYRSNCEANHAFKRVEFTHLMDSLNFYNKQYIEVSGKYIEGKEKSVLVNDSLMADHSAPKALWVDFSPDCPLYLSGTREGLFEYNDGQFTRISGKTITLRGRIDIHNNGHLKQYKATIDRLSLVKL